MSERPTGLTEAQIARVNRTDQQLIDALARCVNHFSAPAPGHLGEWCAALLYEIEHTEGLRLYSAEGTTALLDAVRARRLTEVESAAVTRSRTNLTNGFKAGNGDTAVLLAIIDRFTAPEGALGIDREKEETKDGC